MVRSPDAPSNPPSSPVPPAPPSDRASLEVYLAALTNYETQAALPTDRRALGPARCRALLERAGLLPPRARVIQVAGSKGKGSTVLWMETLLAGRAIRATAFLSPHLERLEERFRLDGAPIAPESLVTAVARLHEPLRAGVLEDPMMRPTFFDLVTAIAVEIAHEAATPYLLLEVGLGGPLDSTSAVPHDVGVLTTIDLEHRAQLGNTLGEIAAEKARIARRETPFILAADDGQSAEARESAARVAADRGAEVREVAGESRVPADLPAPQRHNLAVAIAALEAAGEPPFSPAEVSTAIERIRLPGRLEILPGPPPLLLDGAHTLRSVEHFAERFRELRRGRPAALLVGTMNDKEWRAAFAPLLGDPTIDWIATSVPGPRAVEAEEIAEAVRSTGGSVEVLPLPAAVSRLAALAPRALAVTGSFHLAGSVRSLWPPSRRER